MSATGATAVPPFRHIDWAPRDIALDRRADGTMLMRSRVALGPVAPHLPSFVRRWGTETPTRTFLTQLRGLQRDWHRLSYGETLAKANALTQALINLDLPAGQPVAILSGNSLEHALMMLAAMQAGRPAAPVSPSYSLVSQDHAKLRHVFALIKPAVIMVQDGPPFEKALAALDLRGMRIVHVDRPPAGFDSLSFHALAETPVTSDVQARG